MNTIDTQTQAMNVLDPAPSPALKKAAENQEQVAKQAQVQAQQEAEPKKPDNPHIGSNINLKA